MADFDNFELVLRAASDALDIESDRSCDRLYLLIRKQEMDLSWLDLVGLELICD